MQKTAAEIAGWVGISAILLAYALVSFEVVTSQSFAYQGLNLFGSALLIYLGLVRKVFQIIFLNVVWLAVGLVALYNLFF
jgi:hypothetical protein